MMDTIIREVQIASDHGWRKMDIGIEHGLIVELSESLLGGAKHELVGEGAYCLPGGVDLHVHFNEPGRTHWEGFETGSAAAVAAGVTYLAEMPLNSIPSTVDVAALETKLAAVAHKSFVDFGLWGGVVPGNVDDLIPLAEAGVMGFKAFMSPSGTDDFTNSDAATLRAAMRQIAQTGLRLAFHAEDPAVLRAAEQRLRQRVSAYDWEASRPVAAEISAVQLAIDLAGETGCPIMIVHVSSPAVLAVIATARAQGVDIICETCPHYLLLSTDDAEAIGSDAKCAPPLRSPQTVAGLRAALLDGQIDTLGSDHSPSSPELKQGKAFYDAWGGIAGIQHGWPLVLNHFGLAEPIILQRLLAVGCENPAKIMGLKQKGALRVGMDADFSLIRQQQAPARIEAASLLTRHARSAYVGTSTHLLWESTWLRGQCVVKGGVRQSAPAGKFMPGSCSI
jgi:allantoinase